VEYPCKRRATTADTHVEGVEILSAALGSSARATYDIRKALRRPVRGEEKAMSRQLKALIHSLEIRLLVPLSLTVAVVLAVHAILGYRSTEDRFARFVHTEIERSSRLIKGATHDGMLLNRLDEVQTTIERLAGAPEVAAIRVYNKVGRIILSADPTELGQADSLESETCIGCHEENEAKGSTVLEQRSLMRSPEGHDVLRHLTVLENEPACARAACHFHPADERVLGVLDVEMSMAPFDAAMHAELIQLIWTTLVLILISGFVAALFIRRVIHTPVQRLYDGTQRIAAGDLDTRIDVAGENELARLAEAFNRMVIDLKEARSEVLDWSQTLEQKVEAKTRELQQVQHQVQHMETMASLGKLSATVAHELNNPISGILTYTRLVMRELREQPIDASARAEIERYLTLMDKECNRCGAIVHNLLAFARRKGAQMSPVDLNEIVDRSVMLIRHHLEISNIRLETTPLEGDAKITADSGQLQQALLALMMNAVEAMQAGEEEGTTLSVRLAGDEGHVEIEVADTGVGIAPEDLSHVFEPFFSTKTEQSGVGLGLAVVYGIVNRHDGVIEVRSQPGRGTTFRISLPRHPDPSAERPADQAVGAAARR
jgi:two-component system NtrC family sensor kinase